MNFKITAIKKNNKKSEALFETQYIHYHLETPSGMQMTLKYHETGYSENKVSDTVQNNIRLEAVITPKLIILTQEELLEYFKNYAGKTKDSKKTYQNKSDLGEKFERFESQQKGERLYGDTQHIKTQDKKLLEFFNQFKNKKVKTIVDAEMNTSLKTEVVALEELNEKIVSYNSSNLAESIIKQASAKLSADKKKSTIKAASENKYEKLPKKAHPQLF